MENEMAGSNELYGAFARFCRVKGILTVWKWKCCGCLHHAWDNSPSCLVESENEHFFLFKFSAPNVDESRRTGILWCVLWRRLLHVFSFDYISRENTPEEGKMRQGGGGTEAWGEGTQSKSNLLHGNLFHLMLILIGFFRFLRIEGFSLTSWEWTASCKKRAFCHSDPCNSIKDF